MSEELQKVLISNLVGYIRTCKTKSHDKDNTTKTDLR